MTKIIVASILVIGGLVVMGKARGPASLLGFVMLIAGIVGGVSLYLAPST